MRPTMRVEIRRFKYRTNLIIIPECEAESILLDEMDGGELGKELTAETRLSDPGETQHYMLVVGVDRQAH